MVRKTVYLPPLWCRGLTQVQPSMAWRTRSRAPSTTEGGGRARRDQVTGSGGRRWVIPSLGVGGVEETNSL